MTPEDLFALGYVVCAAIAASAWRAADHSSAGLEATKAFWLRITFISGVFAVLRVLGAHKAVSHAFTTFDHSEGLQSWERPGPYLMLAAIAAGAIALAGLLVFRRRASHSSIMMAASAIVGLVLLALAHSLSLYLPITVLQAQLGPLTVSRIVEIALLAALGVSGLKFIADARRLGERSVA